MEKIKIKKSKRIRNIGILLLIAGLVASFVSTLISLALMLTSTGFLMYSSIMHRRAREYRWAFKNPQTEVERYLAKVEKAIVKRGISAASWKESRRDFKINGVTVDLLIKGDTGIRGMGVAFSRIMEKMVPSYPVAVLIFSRESQIPLRMVKQIFKAAFRHVEREKLHWCCVFVASSEGFSSQCINYVESLLDRRIGFVLFDLREKTIHRNPVFISKSLVKYAKI
ncbi:MAG: hypothetical protein GTN80_09735 [Nitrososphaeria archaeon]|nr:hypothetical protein [Nitrososphaeria archaeon]NIN53390.1 hypothetical protein [Nitrososphaeria archaeon]NIQ33902.1 hypothetical protein [Nitrososphaeria archaeon]